MYSQYDEEKYILEICKPGWLFKEPAKSMAELHVPEPPGRFFEFGAWHPIDKSNTRALYELGWSGVMFEPSPGPMLNLLNEYADDERITLVQAAVGVEPGVIEMHVTDDAVSTADRTQYDAWKSITKFRGKMMVPVLSVAQVFEKFGGDFEMISIDTEGSSFHIWLEMLRCGPRPRCIVLEHDGESIPGRYVEIARAMEANHYEQVHLNGTNIVMRWTGRREW